MRYFDDTLKTGFSNKCYKKKEKIKEASNAQIKGKKLFVY